MTKAYLLSVSVMLFFILPFFVFGTQDNICTQGRSIWEWEDLKGNINEEFCLDEQSWKNIAEVEGFLRLKAHGRTYSAILDHENGKWLDLENNKEYKFGPKPSISNPPESLIGSNVVIQGLSKKPQFNDMRGKITRMGENGRLGVQVDGHEKPISINPINLKLDTDTAAWRKRILETLTTQSPLTSNPKKRTRDAYIDLSADDDKIVVHQIEQPTNRILPGKILPPESATVTPIEKEYDVLITETKIEMIDLSDEPDEPPHWICVICTFKNAADTNICAMCNSGKSCWSCKNCTLTNDNANLYCQACNLPKDEKIPHTPVKYLTYRDQVLGEAHDLLLEMKKKEKLALVEYDKDYKAFQEKLEENEQISVEEYTKAYTKIAMNLKRQQELAFRLYKKNAKKILSGLKTNEEMEKWFEKLENEQLSNLETVFYKSEQDFLKYKQQLKLENYDNGPSKRRKQDSDENDK